MEVVVPAIVGTLLLAGLIRGIIAVAGRRLEERRHRLGHDDILLAFPLEDEGGVRGHVNPIVADSRTAAPGTAGVAASQKTEADHEKGHQLLPVPSAGRPVLTGRGETSVERGDRLTPAFRATAAAKDSVVAGDDRSSAVGESTTANPAASRESGVKALPFDTPSSRPRLVASAPPPVRDVLDFRGPNTIDTPSDVTMVPQASETFEGRTIRFDRADARTMRLLPGRLEVEEGEDSRAEIRFVDLPGRRPEVTFGRSAGEPLRHVQLRSPTVSRQHARMQREGGDWVVVNLSQTNPIVVNGVELARPEEQRTLRDGDRIEMGEVIFRYYVL